MQQFELNAELRGDMGKGASRRLRRLGRVPGIVYGTSREAMPIMLAHDDLANQLKHEAFLSHILTIHLGGRSEKVVLKDLQRHAYMPLIMHVDFQRIDENKELTMRVPIHYINEARCVGVREGGGTVSHIMTEVEISCLPRHLPEFIEVDLAEVKLNETIHLGDLKLPEGVAIYALKHGGDASQPVVNVHIPRAIEIEEEVPAEAAAAALAEAAPAEPGVEAEPGAEVEPQEPGADRDKGKDKGKGRDKGKDKD